MNNRPDLLTLADAGEGRYRVFQPDDAAEGRDVVFSGQLLGQMIMAADRAAAGAHEVRSIHAVFARAGSYTKPIELEVEAMHAGRTWASDTVTAVQDGRLLSRGLVLLHAADGDLMRHDPVAPSGVARPEDLEPVAGQAFPGAEIRPVPGEASIDGAPAALAWHRYLPPLDAQAAHQAVLAWATCGDIIGLAMRPHRDRVRIEEAHRSLSTGVIGHTVHFPDRVDVSRWLLIVSEATKAGAGRVYGGGRVFTEAGELVAAFHQDSMAKAATAPLDPRRAM